MRRKMLIECFSPQTQRSEAGERKAVWVKEFRAPSQVFAPRGWEQTYEALSEGYAGYKVNFVKTGITSAIKSGWKVTFNGDGAEYRVRHVDKLSDSKKIIISIEEMENDGIA